ncbi:hypothetical protein [Halorubellus litoreus]
MAVVHEYVPNSSKSGFYIRDGFDGKVVTYQVSVPAENLLRALDFEDGDSLPNELFGVLNKLQLIYTHHSGVEPIESLKELSDLDSEIGVLEAEDREEMLEYLLNHVKLEDNEEAEIREYAADHDISLKELSTAKSSDQRPDTDDATPGHEDTSDPNRSATKPPSRYSGKNLGSPEIECEYCAAELNAVDYLNHVKLLGGTHSEPGEFPDDFTPGTATVLKDAGADIIYPEDSDDGYRYYPVCRWCGQRFFRFPAFEIHLDSNREGKDLQVHEMNPERYSRPVLLPFDGDDLAVSRQILAEGFTDTALSDMSFATDSLGRPPNDWGHETWRATESDTEQSERNAGSQGPATVPERREAYEKRWLLVGLSRFLKILSKYTDDESIRTELTQQQETIIDRLHELRAETEDTSLSLREYRESWTQPQDGLKVPDELLDELLPGKYRGDLYVPPGYCYPIESVYDRMERAWIEQQFPSGNESSPSPHTSDTAVPNQEQNGTEETADSGSVMVSLDVIQDTLETFRAHEDAKRESSWFHAAEILRNNLDQDTNKQLQSDSEATLESDTSQ